jgi:hypothetical protein
MALTARTDDEPALPSTDTLYGDLRDAILDRLRAMPKPYTVMSEKEQGEMIEGVERVASHLVHQAVKLIAANGKPTIPATVEQCTAKDGIKVVLKVSLHDPLRYELLDAVGKPALLVVADASPYMGEDGPVKPDPDQPPLPEVDGETGEIRPFRGRDK